jgi:hypothetical protein
MEIQSRAIFHLTPRFGKLLLTDITPGSITQHQAARKKAGASNRTGHLERQPAFHPYRRDVRTDAIQAA